MADEADSELQQNETAGDENQAADEAADVTQEAPDAEVADSKTEEADASPTENAGDDAAATEAIPADEAEGAAAAEGGDGGEGDPKDDAEAAGDAGEGEGEKQEGGEVADEEGAAAASAEGAEAADPLQEGDESATMAAAAEGEAAEAGEGDGTAETAPATDGETAGADGEEAAGEAAQDAGEQPPASTDEFAEGERTESPARVSERLSRGPTPTADELARVADRIDEEDEDAERLEATSPDAVVATFDQIGLEDEEGAAGGADAGDEAEEDYEEEEVEEEEFNREFMIASYKQAMAEREQKLHQNSLLQTKLSDFFRRKKADQGGQAEAGQETEKSITDQEQRYAKFVFNLDELRRSRDSKRQEFDDRIKELELECQSREEEVRLMFQVLLDAKKKIGVKAVSATNGRPFPAVTQRRTDGSGGKAQDPLSTSVEDMLQDEAQVEDQVVRVRLDNIGLSNRVRKCETALKAKEELSEGLHMIDFEQLKIENQTYNEKIEERQEELLKLKKKITNNVQVLTHLKEKLQFVQCTKQEQCESLNDLDQTLSKRRDQLTRTKQIRDSLRNDNQRLKQNSGLLGNEALLRNFEENVDLVGDKRVRLDQLKMDHSEMTLQCGKLKRKIDVARAQSAQ